MIHKLLAGGFTKTWKKNAPYTPWTNGIISLRWEKSRNQPSGTVYQAVELAALALCLMAEALVTHTFMIYPKRLLSMARSEENFSVLHADGREPEALPRSRLQEYGS
jgi:hypothetical protein